MVDLTIHAPQSERLHHLLVTPDPNRPREEDFYSYEVECPGVTDECRLYQDCLAGAHEVAALEAAVDNGVEPVAHGVKHLHINGTWMAATDGCYVATHDGLGDAVAGSFAPGRHTISWDVGDGTELIVFGDSAAVPA